MSELHKRLAHIKEMMGKKPYVYFIIPLSLVYAIFSFGTVRFIHGGIQEFYRSMFATYTIPYTLMTLVISVLMGVSLTLFFAKLKEVRLKSAGLGATGIIVGSLAAGCPGCFFGLFPLFLGLFGISATLAILPFNGLELQAISIPILLLSIWTLGKETTEADLVCDISKKKKKR